MPNQHRRPGDQLDSISKLPMTTISYRAPPLAQKNFNFDSSVTSGPLRLAMANPSPQAATTSITAGRTSHTLPFQLEPDPRALPPASFALSLIPLLVLLVLALRPKSRFRSWCSTSLEDFLGLFRPIRQRRHEIHDKPYLNRVLEAEFGGHRPSSDSSTGATPTPPAREATIPSPAEEPEDRGS